MIQERISTKRDLGTMIRNLGGAVSDHGMEM